MSWAVAAFIILLAYLGIERVSDGYRAYKEMEFKEYLAWLEKEGRE